MVSLVTSLIHTRLLSNLANYNQIVQQPIKLFNFLSPYDNNLSLIIT